MALIQLQLLALVFISMDIVQKANDRDRLLHLLKKFNPSDVLVSLFPSNLDILMKL